MHFWLRDSTNPTTLPAIDPSRQSLRFMLAAFIRYPETFPLRICPLSKSLPLHQKNSLSTPKHRLRRLAYMAAEAVSIVHP